MRVHIVRTLDLGRERASRQLKLPAWLQRDRSPAALERNHVLLFKHRLPAVLLQTLEQRSNLRTPRRIFIRNGPHRAIGIQRHRNLFVLYANLQLRGRLAAPLKVRDQVA